jgi:N-acetylmuramoyl-L-alanine amidase
MRRLVLALGLFTAGVAPALAETRPAAPVPAPAVANEARLAGDATRTRFVVDLDRAVPIAVFPLADPFRVVVDLPEVTFAFAPGTGGSGRGLVQAFRFGRFAEARSRIVLDMAEPALVERAFVLPPADGQPGRLVVDLVRASREEVLRAVERDTRLPERPRSRPAAPPAGRAAAVERPPGAELPLVVIDPGHGGVDAGATASGGQPEKTIVLDFARALRTALERSGRVRVAMTREDDAFVALDERVRFARERQAALFLSIHADSLARFLGVSGASVYTVSDRASDREAAAYAERENRADLVAGVEQAPESEAVADILFDLMHRETKHFSVHFARLLVEQLRPQVRLVRNPHRHAGFRVLRAPDVPSALLELGYLSNRNDLRQLTNPQWRERTAEAISRAVLAFVATSRGRSSAEVRTSGAAQAGATQSP